MLERRAKRRAKTALPGSATFARVAAETRCVILNLSGRGACIAFAPDVAVPRVFELQIGRDPERQIVRVVWRRANMVGVGFMAPRAVPDVIAG
ncbi:PilZ domain-containing protein [Methylobacterium sp. PvR107]|uniref:PilZ domain-containing protein n=1 Tax=Methylobacterium sp. PvR107 TaxID=2806597 RepID=UPI001AE5BC9A